MSRLMFNYLFAPIDAPSSGDGGSIEDNRLSKEDIITFLEDDDEAEVLDLDEKTSKADKKTKSQPESKKETVDDDEALDKKEADEDKDELDDLEEDLKEPTDDDLELVLPPRRREVLAKYPEIFKDFPYLEKAMYREQKYAELLPTIEDAREAVEKAKALDTFETDLSNGDIRAVLKSVRDSDQNAFYGLVDNLLSHIHEVDEKAHLALVGNVLKEGLVSAFSEGKRSDNDALKSAAHVLYQYIFGTSEYEPPVKLAKANTKDPKVDEVEKERQELDRERFETARNELATRLDNTLKATIAASIDPKGTMSDYVKKNAVREAGEKLQELIREDKRFKNILNQYWLRAHKNKYSKDSVEDIRRAYLSKAKGLLPSVLKMVRNEALKGNKSVTRDNEERQEPRKKVLVSGDSAAPSKSGKSQQSGKGVPSGMSTYDFLMSDD